jgi:putative peptide zinc metalloprotease protein
VLAIIAILIPVAGVIYMIVRIARRSALSAWQGTADKPVMRTLAMLLGAVVVTGVAYAWWPGEGNYRPIQPWERGTIGDIAYALGVERLGGPRQTTAAPSPAAASRQLGKGQRGVVQSVWDTRTPPPTFTQPQLAVILIPKAVPGARVGGGGGGVAAPTTTADQGWVFPVSKPLAAGPGDTQALAVNTTDNTVEYEAAFAMVWVDDQADAMNVNEAHAYASCDSCAAVAVAYQVVFVIESDETDNNVAAPQNLAGALNYDCVNCLTYALAEQLFITLDRPLTEEEMAKLDEIWGQIEELETRINNGELTLEEIDAIDDQLAGYTAQIKEVVAPAMATSTAPSTAVQTAAQSTAASAPSTVPPTTTQPSTAVTTATSSPSPTVSSTATSSAPPTVSSQPTSSATSSAPSITSEPTASTDSTSDATGSTTDGTTSDGSTSGGTATSP